MTELLNYPELTNPTFSHNLASSQDSYVSNILMFYLGNQQVLTNYLKIVAVRIYVYVIVVDHDKDVVAGAFC